LCQDLQCGVISRDATTSEGLEYSNSAPQGELYELKPTMKTIARTLQHLLLGAVWDPRWESLKDLAAFWNSQHPQHHMTVEEERRIVRSVTSDLHQVLQRATVAGGASDTVIHIELDPVKNMATCRHQPRVPSWAAQGSEVHRAHLQRALSGAAPGCSRESALALLWPAFLGGAMLEALKSEAFTPTPHQAARAILSAPYETRQVDDSGYLVSGLTLGEKARAQQAAARQVLDAVGLAATLAAGSSSHTEDQAAVRMGRDSLLWLLQMAPEEVPTRDLAAALAAVTPDMIQADLGLMSAMEERGSNGLMLKQMLGYATQATPLVKSFQGLDAFQAMDMMRFAYGTRSKHGPGIKLSWQ